MGKSYRGGDTDRNYRDDYEIYSKNEQERVRHRHEKKISAALKSKNIRALIDDDDDGEED